jgi:hypothetical protein
VSLRRHIAIASAALLLAGVLLGGVVSTAVANNKESCSAACRTSYGACYKKSQDRAKCQSQLQRCLEGCIRRR